MTAHAHAGTAWSVEQEAIFAAMQGDRSLCIQAGPGSGKTTTLVEAFSRAREDRVMCTAFGRETRDSLMARLPRDIDVFTWNGFGSRALRSSLGDFEFDNLHPWKLAEKCVGRGRARLPARAFIVDLLSAAKAALAAPDELDELADTAGLAAPLGVPRADLVGHTSRLLAAQLESPGSVVTYDDQLWMPVVHDLPVPRYDLVGVDEQQDLTPCQIELAWRAGDRHASVGDPRQAIYSWRGAAPDAMQQMARRTDAMPLSLLTCYRCGTEIVSEVCKVWPGIVSPEGMHRGSVRHVERDAFEPAPGDFVVSRTNAPILSLCLQWIGQGIRCRIVGRDVAEGLAKWIKRVGCADVSALLQAVDAFEAREIPRLEARDRDTGPVRDRCAAVRAVCDGLDTVDEVLQRLDDLFVSDPERGQILLMSTHRAKGLEADTVWVLRDTYCRQWIGPREARRPVHRVEGAPTEEKNLYYVALSRAKQQLNIVKGIA